MTDGIHPCQAAGSSESVQQLVDGLTQRSHAV